MNLRLFLLLITIESLSFVGGLFILEILFFLYFGSGAGSSSNKTILSENVMIIVLILMPILLGIFKYFTLTNKDRAKSYFYSGLIVSIVSGIYFSLYIY